MAQEQEKTPVGSTVYETQTNGGEQQEINIDSTLVSKLVAVMKAVDHIDKQGTAPAEAGGYAYMYAKDIAHAFRKELAARDIICMGSVIHTERWTDVTAKGRPVQGIDVTMRFTFYDGYTGEQMSVDSIGSGLGGDKAAYKAQTGALKYALRSAFLVPDAAADAEAEEPTADTHEYVKAPRRLQQEVPTLPADEGTDDAWGGEDIEQHESPARPQRTQQAPYKRATAVSGKKVFGPPKDPHAKITDPQRGRLFAISKNAGLSEDEVHEIIRPFGFTSTNDITKGQYDKICAIVESGGLRD